MSLHVPNSTGHNKEAQTGACHLPAQTRLCLWSTEEQRPGVVQLRGRHWLRRAGTARGTSQVTARGQWLTEALPLGGKAVPVGQCEGSRVLCHVSLDTVRWITPAPQQAETDTGSPLTPSTARLEGLRACPAQVLGVQGSSHTRLSPGLVLRVPRTYVDQGDDSGGCV